MYVDDVLITVSLENEILDIKKYLDASFTIKVLGHVQYFLRLEVAGSIFGLFLNQKKYVLDILQDTRLVKAKPSKFPLSQGIKLDNETRTLLTNPEKYRS